MRTYAPPTIVKTWHSPLPKRSGPTVPSPDNPRLRPIELPDSTEIWPPLSREPEPSLLAKTFLSAFRTVAVVALVGLAVMTVVPHGAIRPRHHIALVQPLPPLLVVPKADNASPAPPREDQERRQ
jgi:hypothetical protein